MGYAAIPRCRPGPRPPTRQARSTGAKVAAVLDTFDKTPLVIGPTTYTSKLHIQTTRPMAILNATNGKFSCVGRFTVKLFPPLQ